MRRTRSAKIVATLGPSTSDEKAIRALFERGVDVFRLNFSHGTQSDHAQRLETIRGLEKDFGRPIGVLLDLQGPKLRLGTFNSGKVQLDAGARFRLDMDKTPGNNTRAPTQAAPSGISLSAPASLTAVNVPRRSASRAPSST
jgi:pyruvate kinase